VYVRSHDFKLNSEVVSFSAFVGAVDQDGVPMVKGRRFTRFSNQEETLFGTVLVSWFRKKEFDVPNSVSQDIPFSLEDRLVSLGGAFEPTEPFQVCFSLCIMLVLIRTFSKPRVIISDNLYTGQNPASAKPLAEEILKTLRK
jgi:hypothetical protein